MAQGLTLQQLQDMGATPVQNEQTPVQVPQTTQPKGQGMTLEQLKSMGATPTQSTSQDTKKESMGIGLFKDVGNFLFPIVGDVYHDIKGDSNKTFLQQAGDTALSVLPFIPGLGELGMGAKAAKLGIEGAEAVKSAGLLSKGAELIKGSAAAKGAITGYGAGVASNLSQGQGVGQSLMPNVNTIGGTVLGGATPAVMKGLSSFTKTLSGISPEVSLAFQRDFTEKDLPEVQRFIDIAKKRASGEIMPSVENTAADKLDEAVQKVQQKTDEAGSIIGQVKQKVGNNPLETIKDVGQSFWKKVQDDYGLNLMTKPDGTIVAKSVEGRNIQVSPTDKKRILNIAQQLSDLGTKPSTVGEASDVLHNINNLVDFSKQDIYGNKNDPLEGLIKYAGGNLNNKIRTSAPELAIANDKFSNLKGIQEEIRQMAGNKLQRGELLMKRVFTNNSKDSIELFNTLKNETGIDLQKYAIMAKHAIDSFGGAADKSLLEKMITGATQGKSGLINSTMEAITNKARQTLANPERIGTKMIKDKTPGLISKLGGKNLITKGAIKAGTSLLNK